MLELKRKRQPLAPGLLKRGALVNDAAILVREPATLIDADTGKIMAIYDILDFDDAPIAAELKRIKFLKGKRTLGLKSTSKIFGYRPRLTLRQDYCSAAQIAVQQPSIDRMLKGLGRKAAEIYERYWPGMFLDHRSVVTGKVRDEYIIEGTPFTSGIVNRDSALKYHFDRGNFPGLASAMFGFKGHIEGGYLVMPEYGVAFEICNRSLTIFDGQDILHGVTPFVKAHRDGYRFTVVYYSLQQLWKCEAPSAELARIRNVKMERERRRAV